MLSNLLSDARSHTDGLFARVSPDAFLERPIPERHRLVFYVGHLEAFDWNLLRPALDLPPFSPTFDRLFAFGIDPPPGQLPNEAPSEWPAMDEIHAYNNRVRRCIDERLTVIPESLLHVAVEHRLMHLETLCYLIHQLHPKDKHGPIPAPPAPQSTQAEWIDVPAGIASLGQQAGNGFGWDNEFTQHQIPVAPFRIQKQKVSNGDYLRLVNNGGAVPPFWRREGNQWLLRTVFGEVPLPLDWPAYVTWSQAEQYARSHGWRLPSEAEWTYAAQGSRPEGNLDLQRFDPEPVHAPGSVSNFGVTQLLGNGWEWTATPFGPYPGFQEFAFYPNYSEPFFDGDHYVLKGASPVTAAKLTRPTFRNWFRRDYPYVYAAFRCVEAQ